MSVCDFYVSSLSFDARKKKLVHLIKKFFVNNLAYQIFNFWPEAELLNFAVSSLIFHAIKKKN